MESYKHPRSTRPSNSISTNQILFIATLLVSSVNAVAAKCVECTSVQWLSASQVCAPGYTALPSTMCDGRGATYFCDDVGPEYKPVFGRRMMQAPEISPVAHGINSSSNSSGEVSATVGHPWNNDNHKQQCYGHYGRKLAQDTTADQLEAIYLPGQTAGASMASTPGNKSVACQIAQSFGTSSGYTCGCLCVKVLASSPGPASPPKHKVCQPPNYVGPACKSPPTQRASNANQITISRCTNVQSGSYCWASCAPGYVTGVSSANQIQQLQAQCCQGVWRPWEGRCVLGASCAAPPEAALAPPPANVDPSSVTACVNVQSTDRCKAQCSSGYVPSNGGPSIACLDGNWDYSTGWKGECVKSARAADKPAAQKGRKGANTFGKLCSTDLLPPSPRRSDGWSCLTALEEHAPQSSGGLQDVIVPRNPQGHERQPRPGSNGEQRQQVVQHARRCVTFCTSGAGFARISCVNGTWERPEGTCSP